MNQIFRDHVTSVAFSLTLSRAMIRRLLLMGLHPALYFTGESHELKTLCCLQERGLVIRREWAKYNSYVGCFFQPPVWVLTREGELIVELLKSAGFTLEDAGVHQAIIDAAKERGSTFSSSDE